MDVDEDCIYVSSQPQVRLVASDSAKRRPVARMHASRVSKARKSLKFRKKNTNTVSRLPPRPRRAIASNTAVGVPDWTVVSMGGKCPPFNDNAGWMHDPVNRRIYMYGGLPPGDDSDIPTSDFYVCDTTTMQWKNISNSFKFRNPYNPFSRDDRHRKATPLPQLLEPGCTILTIDNSQFIFIFGGYDVETEEASSKIIVIDLHHLEWWYLQLEGEGVQARIEPVVVAVDAKLYVFGGYRQQEENEDDHQPFNSYSVAEFLQDEQWHWTVRDQPYSNVIPQGHLFGKAIPVYNGAKILLTPGRISVSDNRVQFKEDNLFYYHIARKRFQLADITGDFPTELMWYSIHEHRPRLPVLPATPTCISSPAQRGRPRKALPVPSSTPNTLPLTQPIASTPSPSLIICGWIPITDKDAAPELWQLFLTPDERIDRLNISQQIFDLNHDFQGFACVDGKMRLMGSDHGHTDADTGEEDLENPDTKWNIFLDVPMPNGK